MNEAENTVKGIEACLLGMAVTLVQSDCLKAMNLCADLERHDEKQKLEKIYKKLDRMNKELLEESEARTTTAMMDLKK